MLSVLFCSRAKDNPDCGLKRLLDSTADCTTPAERRQIEFLIKFDSDDDVRTPDSELAQYPFAIKPFVWSRGEGRHGLHHAQEYMFANRDLRSRFCLMTADDFFFSRAGFVSEILAVEDEFCVMGHRRPPIESFAGRYEQEEAVREWVVSFGCWSPVISSRLIEVCQNFGWQANVDSWLMGLSVALYDLYGIVIWKQHHPFYERGGNYERPASMGAAPTYNNMELTNNVGPLNKYWFELVKRQARNVYLNMTFGTDLRNRGWSEKLGVAWHKFRSQPVRRLPGRVFRKLRHNIASVFA
jgi:hypothetical protein